MGYMTYSGQMFCRSFIIWFWIELMIGKSSVSADLLPEKPYIFIGEQLVLNCTDDQQPISGVNYYFTKSNYIIPSDNVIYVNNRTSILNITVTGINDGGRYGCWSNSSQDQEILIGSQIVTTEYPPEKVRNLSCVVHDWTDGMQCDWNLGIEYINMDDIVVKLYYNIFGRNYICPHQTSTSCVWKLDFNPPIRQMLISVSVNNAMRSSTVWHQEYISALENVKPSTPIDFIERNVDQTCITLHWTHKKHRPKIYRLRYVLQNQTAVNKEIIKDMNITEEFCGLTPYSTYTFLLDCKPVKAGYWSDNVEIIVKTLQDVPLTGPVLGPGSFEVTNCDGKNERHLSIYWGNVNEENKRGKIIGYLVVNNGKNMSFPANTHRQVYSHISCQQNQSFKIYSQTEMGHSLNYSEIYVSPPNYGQVNNFTVELLELDNNRREIKAMWTKETSELEVYTVYWCLLNVKHRCQDGIKWKSADESSRNMVLPVPTSDWRKYVYGISNSIHGISSGINWTKCRIYKNAIPPKPPLNIKVTEKSEALDVRWSSERCSLDSEAFIHSYIISVCPTDYCYETTRQTYDVGGDRDQYFIDKLKPNVNYSISIQSVAMAGRGPKSSAIYGIPTKKDGILETYIIVFLGISAAIVIVLVGLGVYYCVIKKCWSKYKINMPDMSNVPNLDSPNYVYNLHSPTRQQLLDQPTTQLSETLLDENIEITSDPNNTTIIMSNITSTSIKPTMSSVQKDVLNKPNYSLVAVNAQCVQNGYLPNGVVRREEDSTIHNSGDYNKITISGSLENSNDESVENVSSCCESENNCIVNDTFVKSDVTGLRERNMCLDEEDSEHCSIEMNENPSINNEAATINSVHPDYVSNSVHDDSYSSQTVSSYVLTTNC